MNTTELPLPEKIFPVEYAGFFDFNEEGVYDTSVINRDDYPNAEQIANEISKRYNNFDKMKEALIKAQDKLAYLYGYNMGKNAVSDVPDMLDDIEQLLESLK